MEKMIRLLSAVIILALMIYVIVSPTTYYAPPQRALLYVLASLSFAILLGGEAQARLKLKLPGFLFIAGGSAAVAFALLYFLTTYFKPEHQIAAYSVFDRNGQAIDLEWDGALSLPPNANGLSANWFVKKNIIVVIFPEQVPEQKIRLKTTSDGPTYSGTLSYAGSRKSDLIIGKDLNTPN